MCNDSVAINDASFDDIQNARFDWLLRNDAIVVQFVKLDLSDGKSFDGARDINLK